MTPPKLIEVTPDTIPATLRATPRWANWAAKWSVKRKKYDKIPKHPKGYGISTASPHKWRPFQEAADALLADFAGVGYLMSPSDRLVGIDLDKCVSDGVIAPWAQDIITQVNSYTEFSPSGNGIRIFGRGVTTFDWTDHARGIEVYAGHTARFLTVTGAHIPGTPADIIEVAPGVLQALTDQYATDRHHSTPLTRAMPEVTDPPPEIRGLGLLPTTMDYLLHGEHGQNDRSLSLIRAATDLGRAGLTAPEILSVLALNPFSWADALDKREQDPEKAMLFLWVHQAQCGKAKADNSRMATADDFELLDAAPALAASDAPVAERPPRFTFSKPSALRKRQRLSWIIKGVLPQGEVGAVYGESTAGKSFVVLDMVASVARGVEWRGHRVGGGGVAYVCAEGANGFLNRIAAYEEFHGVDFDTIPFHMLADSPSLLDRVDVTDLVASLRAIGPLSVIVIDTLAQVTPGADENSGADMGRALGHAKAIHMATRAMVILVAHSGKDSARGIRGWSGIKGALDVEICVTRNGDARKATITKIKDGDGEGREYGFSLDVVEMDPDEDGDPVTSCVLKACVAVEDTGTKKGVPWRALLVEKLQSLLALDPAPVSKGALVAATVATVPPEHKDPSGNFSTNCGKAVESAVKAGVFITEDGAIRLR